MAHEQRIPVRWTDFDARGHVSNGRYLEYLDEARWSMISAALGEPDDWPHIVAHTSIDFRRELRIGTKEVAVRVRVTELGRTSLTCEHEVLDAGGEVAATARAVLVAWDSEARRARPLTDEERGRLRPG